MRFAGSVIVVMVAVGCGAGSRVEQPSSPAYDFAGSCSWARGAGDLARYRIPLRFRGTPGQMVEVHSLARIPRSPADRRRGEIVLGQVPAGAVVRGEGPLHGGAESAEAVYAVPVRGVRGRLCRGYVRMSSVERISAP